MAALKGIMAEVNTCFKDGGIDKFAGAGWSVALPGAARMLHARAHAHGRLFLAGGRAGAVPRPRGGSAPWSAVTTRPGCDVRL